MPEPEFPGPEPSPEPEEPSPEAEAPTEEVKTLKQKGLSNDQIFQEMKRKGHTVTQISEALNQAEIAPGIPAPPAAAPPAEAPSTGMQPSIMGKEGAMPEAPTPTPAPEAAPATAPPTMPERPVISMPVAEPVPRGAEEQIQEIAEAIVNEKWESLIEDVGDIGAWKDKVKTELTSIKQEILRLENRFENLQKAITGKVAEYGKGISEVGVEVKALEKVFQKILQPLTTNIKELSKITKKMKK